MVAFYGGELAHAGADAGLNENVTKAMHAGWVMLYFALGCLVLALAIFPEFRRGALPLARVCVRRARRAWATLGGIASGVLGPTPATAAGGRADSRWGDGLAGWTVRWRWIAGGAGAWCGLAHRGDDQPGSVLGRAGSGHGVVVASGAAAIADGAGRRQCAE